VTQTATNIELPLEGVKVLDFSQFLAGPVCAMRLADLGANVIKVERPKGGDLCRQMAVADQWVGDDSLLFHTINRGKSSVCADLKDPADLDVVKRLIVDADVMIHNFRPGVMDRIGLGFDTVRALNPRLVYGVVSGYGKGGPWRDKPGQDLLAQARSGLVWLSGSDGDAPLPFGVSITDITAGAHLAQGILAALFRQARSGRGGLIEVSLLATAMDIQFEQFTSYLNNPNKVQPKRSAVNGANIHATAPYGLYETSDGYMAIAMVGIRELGDLLSLEELALFGDPKLAYVKRDEIKALLSAALKTQTSAHWLGLLEPAGVWCAEVLDYPALLESGALDSLGVVQDVNGLPTTTCPIQIDGRVLRNPKPAPQLGADTAIAFADDTMNELGETG